MKKLLFIILITGNIFIYGQNIIIDHTAVDLYEEIPQQYIDSIKKMWVSLAGESHSSGYRKGLQFLENIDSIYDVSVMESGTPESATNEHLRFSRATWGTTSQATRWRYGYGEADWYTSNAAIEHTKEHLTYCDTAGFTLDAFGFGWCWDMTWQNGVGGTIDPEFQVRWAGASEGGPQGSMRWGLDAEDSILTGNSVCMDNYINATMQYIQYCKDNGYKTKVFFTTGPVDGGGNTGESGYQRYLKHQYIRQFVLNNDNLILFDYADILTWGDDGEHNLITWTDYAGVEQTFPYIHPDNMLDLAGTYAEDGDHIGERGALRMAKAMWYMLARMSGWEGVVNEYITKTNISICEGDSLIVNGAYQKVGGIYYDTLQASDGLDSIIISNLTVNSRYELSIDSIINSGDSILISGIYQKTDGTFIDSLRTNAGCDSVITINLTIQDLCLNTLEYDPQYVTICEGDSMLINGMYRKTEGIYSEVHKDKNGCDSIVQTDLSVINCQDTTDNPGTTGKTVIFKNERDPEIQIFPNPSNGIFLLQLSPMTGNLELEIYSILGQQIYSNFCFSKEVLNNSIYIDLSVNRPGIYLLKIKSSEATYTKRLIKN